MSGRGSTVTERRLTLVFLAVFIVLSNGVMSRSEKAAEIALEPLETRVLISLANVEGRRTGDGDLALHPGESVRVPVTVPGSTKDTEWSLRLIGEVDIDRQLRTEDSTGLFSFFRLIDDALDSRTTHHRTHSWLCAQHDDEHVELRGSPSGSLLHGQWQRLRRQEARH